MMIVSGMKTEYTGGKTLWLKEAQCIRLTSQSIAFEHNAGKVTYTVLARKKDYTVKPAPNTNVLIWRKYTLYKGRICPSLSYFG